MKPESYLQGIIRRLSFLYSGTKNQASKPTEREGREEAGNGAVMKA
jgi:hypothetical protein